TDAEGRLLLADALAYARKLGLSPLVDVATLTGAMMVALGKVATGVMGNDEALAQKLIEAGKLAGEKLWAFPLWEEYKDLIKSDVADIKNVGPREGGALTAGQFLAEFAEDTPWAHLDMAGVDMSDKDKGWLVKGATGIPVRTLVNLALMLAQEKATR
ncbi:MAG TPA: aminopeptidase, partial [Dehalococcoidia bacterium]|nr:aminopeptidase [Dehalococcoidia bacterium]